MTHSVCMFIIIHMDYLAAFEGTGAAVLDRRHRVLYFCRSERAHPSLIPAIIKAIWPSNSSSVVQFDALMPSGNPKVIILVIHVFLDLCLVYF